MGLDCCLHTYARPNQFRLLATCNIDTWVVCRLLQPEAGPLSSPLNPSFMRLCVGIAFVFALAVLAGCQRKGGAGLASGLPPKLEAKALLSLVDAALFSPKTAELKGDAEVSSESIGDISLGATVRWQRDSIFWFSLRKFGFEGARGRVTADSLIALNRLEREVLVATPDQLPDQARMLPIKPTVGNLTAAFAGQPIGDWSKATVDRQPGRYVLSTPGLPDTKLIIDATRSVPIAWEYKSGAQYGRVDFADFRAAGKAQIFPYERSLIFSDEPGDTTKVLFQFESLSSDGALNYPISIPEDYGKMKI